MQPGLKSYLYLLSQPVGDAFSTVEREFGVRIQVELLQEQNAIKPSMLFWRVWISSRIHRAELHNPPTLMVPYLSPSIVDVDMQISSVIVTWLERLQDHLRGENPPEP